MLRRLRVRAWCLTTAVLLAVGTASASFDALLHGGDVHDPACAPAFTAPHDATAHGFQSVPRDEAEDGIHCVACHLARSLRLRAEAATPAARPDEPRTLHATWTIGATRAPALDNLHPRSPPRVA
jgi:hypothetical protein